MFPPSADEGNDMADQLQDNINAILFSGVAGHTLNTVVTSVTSGYSANNCPGYFRLNYPAIIAWLKAGPQTLPTNLRSGRDATALVDVLRCHGIDRIGDRVLELDAGGARDRCETVPGGIGIDTGRPAYRERDYRDRSYAYDRGRFGGCRTVTIERDNGSVRRIRRCD